MGKKKGAERFGAGRAKKQKKKPLRVTPSTIDQPVSQIARPSTSEAPKSLISSVSVAKARQFSRPQRQELVTDYRYVVSDLKRIAVTAAAMLAIIVGLAFVIR